MEEIEFTAPFPIRLDPTKDSLICHQLTASQSTAIERKINEIIAHSIGKPKEPISSGIHLVSTGFFSIFSTFNWVYRVFNPVVSGLTGFDWI